MKEILDIIAALDVGPSDTAILATVVDLRGSGYRLPGARMLIRENGQASGTVSGGCLESDVLERAERVRKSGRPEIYTYDTTGNETSVFSLNMGCRGVIRILMEPVTSDSPIIGALRKSIKERETFVTATEISGTNIGRRAITGVHDQTPDGDQVIRPFLSSGKPYETVNVNGVDIALERIEPPVALTIFGAGADAVPLYRIASELGWQVTVADHRPAFLATRRFPGAGLVHIETHEKPDATSADRLTAAVLMTHNYSRDKLILSSVLGCEAFYVGALGPKRRTQQLLDELAADGVTFSETQLERLYAPVGLDLGAVTPEGIALAVVAEIQAVLAARSAGHLRDREGPIYGH